MSIIEEWLQPSLERKLLETIDLCDEKTESLYDEVNLLLSNIERSSPKHSYEVGKLRKAFIQKTRTDVEVSFSVALNLGIDIGKQIR